jgi:thiol-disulfide isomerase/thioredoxin
MDRAGKGVLMKYFLAVVLYCHVLYLFASQPQPSSGAAADTEWNALEKINLDSGLAVGTYDAAMKRFGGERTPEFVRWRVQTSRDYRERGLKFWRQFPDDLRRYEWLISTIRGFYGDYWEDEDYGIEAWVNGTPEKARVDLNAAYAWKKDYVALRSEFMASKQVSDERRAELRATEFIRQELVPAVMANRRGERVDWAELINEFWDFASDPRSRLGAHDREQIVSIFVGEMDGDPEMERICLSALKRSTDVELRLIAEGREQVAKLRDKGLELRLPAMGGGHIDLRDYRGKVVLIDIWSNNCLSCIEAMPKLQVIYDKYRERGFEVVGVWLKTPLSAQTNDFARAVVAQELDAALRILRKQGVTWRNGILADEARDEFKEEYSITGVPVTWLLDQNGRLVTTDVRGSRLEATVRSLLQLTTAHSISWSASHPSSGSP